MNSGLSRIILIDALSEGVTCDIPIAGHTNLTGFNDAGKTTLIKLGPLFYGESPLNIGIKKKSGSLKSFAGWYLPRSGSSIVYEYLKEGKKRCLWFHGGKLNEDSFIRTFIEHEFKYDLFVNPENSIPYQPDEVKKSFKQKNIFTHQCSSFQEHRQILLDGKNKFTTFAMVPPRTRLSKLTSLFSGMLTRNTKFDELCKIIEGWCKGDIELRNLENFKLDKSDLLEWQNNYHALSLIKKNNKSFTELSSKLHDFKDAKKELASFYHQAVARKSELETSLDQGKNIYKVFLSEIEQELIQLNNNHISHNLVVKSNLSALTKVQVDIKNLQARQDDFVKKLGENPEAKLISLDGFISQSTALKKQIEFATSTTKNVNEWYQEQKGIIGNSYRTQERSLAALVAKYKEDKNQQISALNTKNSKEVEVLRKEHQAVTYRLEEKSKQFEKEKFETEFQIKNPSSNEKLLRAIKKFHQNKQEALESASNAQSENVINRKKMKDLESEFEKAKRTLKVLQKEEDTIRADLERYQSIKDAKDGSLLSFLKTDIDGWEDSFGRLIGLEILNNKTLKPELMGTDPCSVFGVSLDVSKLPQADFPTEEVLSDKIIQLSNQLKSSTEETEKREEECDRLYKETLLLEQQINKIENSYSEFQRNSNKLQNQITEHQKEVDQEKVTYVKNKESELHTIILSLNDVTKRLSELKIEQETELKTINASYGSILNNLINKFDLKIQSTEEDKDKLTKQEDNDLLELDSTRDAKLSDAGIDFEFVNVKTNELKEANNRIKELNELKSHFYTYTRFKEEEYVELPTFQERLDEVNKKHEQAKQILEKTQKEIKKCEEQERERERQYTISTQAIESNINQLDFKIINVATYKDKVEHYIQSGSIKQLQRAFSTTTSTIDAIKKQLIVDTQCLLDLFKKHAGSSPHSYWVADAIDIDDIENAAEKLVSYIDNDLLNKDVRMLVDKLGQFEKIRTYCSYLEDFEKRVNGFSRQLASHLEHGTGFHGLEKLDAKIVFNLSETQAWDDIKQLTSEFESWRDSVGIMNSTYQLEQNLPPESFVDALEQFTNAKNVDELGIDDMHKYIEFKIDVLDKGINKRLHSHADFGDVSSNGTSYLIMLVLFISFIKMHRKDADVNFLWALDELTNIDSENIHTLFDLLNDSNITLLSACPEVNHAIFHRFTNTRRLNSKHNGHLEMLDVAKKDDHGWVNQYIEGATK